MAKGIYFGINGVARKAKKMYFGVNGIARKVKKAYIGVAGIARVFLSGGEPEYCGETTALSAARYSLAGASTKSHALFAGGVLSGGRSWSNAVEAYSSSLNKSIIQSLSVARASMGAASIGGCAIFAGGQTFYDRSRISNVDAYDSALTYRGLTNLGAARSSIGATSNENYAIFAGGDTRRTTATTSVDAYNTSLTRTTPTALSSKRKDAGAARTGQYGVIAGGWGYPDFVRTVEAYNGSLVRSNPTPLGGDISQNNRITGLTAGDYAVFIGTPSGDSPNRVFAYDKALTQIKPSSVYTLVSNAASATLEGFGMMAGGSLGLGVIAHIQVYDPSLTLKPSMYMGKPMESSAGATVGAYALFAGGYNDGAVYNNTYVVTV